MFLYVFTFFFFGFLDLGLARVASQTLRQPLLAISEARLTLAGKSYALARFGQARAHTPSLLSTRVLWPSPRAEEGGPALTCGWQGSPALACG